MIDYLQVIKKASFSRAFETKVFELLEKKIIQIPVYLSTGQESIAATIATLCESQGLSPALFPQHRNHSTYLSFGGDPKSLALKLLGKECPMEGSASLQCKKIKMFGHDGLMGSQVPIAVGYCYATNNPTITFMGDGAAEEDYVLAALGWASSKNLPILFVVEDNDLSILTKKSVRRKWSIVEVARSFGIESYDIIDDPSKIEIRISSALCKKPLLLNINTNRITWHCGAGIDDPNTFNRLKVMKEEYKGMLDIIVSAEEERVEAVWKEALKTP